MRATRRTQKGAVALVVTFILGALFFGFFLAFSERITQAAVSERDASVQTYLTETRDSLLSAYRLRLGEIDGTATHMTFVGEQAVKTLLLRELPSSMQVDMSDRLADPLTGRYYRRIALWFPFDTDDTGGPQFDRTTGAFVRCGQPISTNGAPACARGYQMLLDTRSLHAEAEAQARRTLNDLATAAQVFFHARMQSDPARDASLNHFRAPYGCGMRQPDEMPCVDTYTPLSDAADAARVLNLNASGRLNPWGLPYELSNLEGSSTEVPPFSMAFRTRTPWGSAIEVKAVEAL